MIVEQKGKNDVLVRYRDENDKRQETVIKEFLPYCFVAKEDAKYIHGLKKTDGYMGVFGTSLTKLEGHTTWDIRDISKSGRTWPNRSHPTTIGFGISTENGRPRPVKSQCSRCTIVLPKDYTRGL